MSQRQEILSKYDIERMEREQKIAQGETRREAGLNQLSNQFRRLIALMVLFALIAIAASYATVYYSGYQHHTHETAQNIAGLTIFVASLLGVASAIGAGLTADRRHDVARYGANY